MFCKQCGRPIDDGQELCEDCKAKMGNSQDMNQNNFQQSNAQDNMNQGNMNQNFNQNYNNNQNYNHTQERKNNHLAKILYMG